jgi:hypothetical protein
VTENQALVLVIGLSAARAAISRRHLSRERRRTLAAVGVAVSLTAFIRQS